jgi:hypothetical protein
LTGTVDPGITAQLPLIFAAPGLRAGRSLLPRMRPDSCFVNTKERIPGCVWATAMTPEAEHQLLLRLARIEHRLAAIVAAISGGSVALLGGYLLGEDEASFGAFFAMIVLGCLIGGIVWFGFRELSDRA